MVSAFSSRSAAASALVLALVPVLASAQGRKLNGPLPSSIAGDVDGFTVTSTGRAVYQALRTNPSNKLISTSVASGGSTEVCALQSGYVLQQQTTPDGARLVYLLHDTTDNLYIANVLGGEQPRKLNGTLASNEDVYSFRISADGARVVYEKSAVGGYTLFAVPVDGSGPPVLLTGQKPAYEYAITADSARVVFRGPAGGGRPQLFSAPITGGVEPLRINDPLPLDGVLGFDLSPDGSRAIYHVQHSTSSAYELYSVPTDGSAPPVKLNGAVGPGGVGSHEISADSTFVTYAGDQGEGYRVLYAVSILGGANVRLSALGTTVYEHAITPDGSTVVYRGGVGNSTTLYAVPTDASSAPVQISGSLPSGRNVSSTFLLDAAAQRVLFLADATTAQLYELYSAPIDGSLPRVRLGPAGLSVNFDFLPTSDGRVVFRDVAGTAGLYSAPVDGSVAAVRLSNALPPSGRVREFALDPSTNRALYRADQDFTDVLELFSVPVDGSAPPALRSDIRDAVVWSGGVIRALVTPDGERALYHAVEAEGRDLYSVTLSMPPVRTRLDALPFGDSFDLVLTPDSQRVVYRCNDFDSVAEYRNGDLYTAAVDGSDGRMLLTPPERVGDAEADFAITPNSQRVVYRFSPRIGQPPYLCSVPVDGSAQQTQLSVAAVDSFRISPNSARVVYMVAGTAKELYSVPTAGGSSVKLNGALVAGGSVTHYAVNPIGTHVAYVADQDTDDVSELYAAPINGSSAPVKLSGPMVAGGDVDGSSLQISPDASRVVYLADRDVDGMVELYSVGLGAAPVELSALGATNRDVNRFVISADSSRVVYTADQDADDVLELYAVPLFGGAPPVKLSQSLVAGGDVINVAVDPTSTYVVYTADAAFDECMELYRVPLDGSAAPIHLNDPIPTNRDVQSFQLDPTGSWVLYGANAERPSVTELYVAALDGLHAVVKINGPLQTAQATVAGAFTPEGDRILYSAPEDYFGITELYLNNVLGPRGRPHVLRHDF